MKKIMLSLLLACLALLGLTACVDTSRQSQTVSDYLPAVYTVELWNEHWQYEFGKPVHLRATLTNISSDTLIFGNGSGNLPVLDIHIKTLNGTGSEERIWSKDDMDQVKYSVVLSPSQSYTITWTLSLSFRTSYSADVFWVDPQGHEVGANPNRIGLQFYYSVSPPGPLP